MRQPRDHDEVLPRQQPLELDAIRAADQLGRRIGLRFDHLQRDPEQGVPVLLLDRVAAEAEEAIERDPLGGNLGAGGPLGGPRVRVLDRDVLIPLEQGIASLAFRKVEADAFSLDGFRHRARAPRLRAEDIEALFAPGQRDVLARRPQGHEEILEGDVGAAEGGEHGDETQQIQVGEAGRQLNLADSVEAKLLRDQGGAGGVERNVDPVQAERLRLRLDPESASPQLDSERGEERLAVLSRLRFVPHDVEQRTEQRGGRVRTGHLELRSRAEPSSR
ncbi:MAG: hypothetical protein DMD43_06540 [Gemmatimonadetes bacterium]|nr:MAG: hypothetical protein DMD43_06540 [Gemmatimonadota bacterium]